MKSPVYKIFSILLILSFPILSGLECHWSGDDDDDVASDNDPAEIEILETRAYATIDTIDATTMDVETDDGVIFTCDLPMGVVLAVGDRVEITIDLESNASQWVITATEFFQRI